MFFSCYHLFERRMWGANMSYRGVYCLIDYYSMMFFNTSFFDILKYYKIDYVMEDQYAFDYEKHINFGTDLYIKIHDITLCVSASEVNSLLLNNVTIDDVMTHRFDSIRLEIKGKGCSYLRDLYAARGDIDANEFLRVDPNLYFMPLGASCRLTRMDFTYDLVNYCGDFFDKVHDFLLASYRSKGSPVVNIYKKPRGVNFELTFGYVKNVYLGSKSSNEFLRIYDKKQQNCPNGQWLKGQDFYGADCKSWIRLELQCREAKARKIAYGTGDLHSVFKYLYDNYRFADLDSNPRYRVPATFWDEIIDWNNPAIIQNAKYVQFRDYNQSLIEFPDRNATTYSVYCAKFGKDRFVDEVAVSCFYKIFFRNDIKKGGMYRYWMDLLKIAANGFELDTLPFFRWGGRDGEVIPIIIGLYTEDEYYSWRERYMLISSDH